MASVPVGAPGVPPGAIWGRVPLGSSRWSCAASGSSCGRFGWTTWRGSPSSLRTPTSAAGGRISTRRAWPKRRVENRTRASSPSSTTTSSSASRSTTRRPTHYRHAGIDLFLGAPYQDRGLGTDTVRTLARHLVHDRGHHRLTIDPVAHNARAIRAYEKAGFRPVGVMREYQREPDGTWSDGLLMDLLARELRP